VAVVESDCVADVAGVGYHAAGPAALNRVKSLAAFAPEFMALYGGFCVSGCAICGNVSSSRHFGSANGYFGLEIRLHALAQWVCAIAHEGCEISIRGCEISH
jgi:hypothetical protein